MYLKKSQSCTWLAISNVRSADHDTQKPYYWPWQVARAPNFHSIYREHTSEIMEILETLTLLLETFETLDVTNNFSAFREVGPGDRLCIFIFCPLYIRSGATASQEPINRRTILSYFHRLRFRSVDQLSIYV